MLPFISFLALAPGIIPALDDIQHRAVTFFWEQSSPTTGYTKDRASNFKESDDHNIASSAAMGFALAAYPIGVEHKWLDREKAIARTKLTLEKLVTSYPQEHGWFYHFVDWQTGERQWKCEASSIDTSILLAGIMVADDYWKDGAIHKLSKAIEDRIDWKWMLTNGGDKPEETTLSMGWHPENGFIPNARWNGYDELTMIYIQAYGFYPDMPEQGWKDVKRDIVVDRGFTFVVGGPLFMHQMSHGFFDLKNKRDSVGMDYWLNTRVCTLANRAYCIDNPGHFKDFGPNFWGLSACDTPEGYAARGTPKMLNDDGTITPTSAVASVSYTPKESLDFLASMLTNHRDAYGKYGFSNGVNPTKNWNDPDVIGIDLGMMMLGVDAYEGGMIHKLLANDPVVKKGMQRMGFHAVPTKFDAPVIDPTEAK